MTPASLELCRGWSLSLSCSCSSRSTPTPSRMMRASRLRSNSSSSCRAAPPHPTGSDAGTPAVCLSLGLRNVPSHPERRPSHRRARRREPWLAAVSICICISISISTCISACISGGPRVRVMKCGSESHARPLQRLRSVADLIDAGPACSGARPSRRLLGVWGTGRLWNRTFICCFPTSAVPRNAESLSTRHTVSALHLQLAS